MRTMLKVVIPVEKGNQAIKDGSLAKAVEQFMSEFKPESAYFYPVNGKRSAQFVFEMQDSSHIPSIAEAFFSGLSAEISLTPVMNADDLKAGLGKLK